MNMDLGLRDLDCSPGPTLLGPLSLWEAGLTDTADAAVGCVGSGVIATAFPGQSVLVRTSQEAHGFCYFTYKDRP